MKKKYFFQVLTFVFMLGQFSVYSLEGTEPTSEKIPVRSNSITSVNDPGWSYTCDDGIEVELLSLGLKNNVPATLDIQETSNVVRLVVEIVYKGKNPGETIQILDADGNSYTATRHLPSGGSSSVWYYRVELPVTSQIEYTNTLYADKAQSMLAYVFREKNNGMASSGVFTALSGYNDVQTTTIPIQTDSGPRTVTVELPISELTPDGRYIHIEVSAADGSSASLTETISSFSSGTCCIKVFELVMNDVAGTVDEINIKIDTRNYKNGQSVKGQSWVMGGAVKTNVRCSCVEFDTEAPTADNFVDYIIIEDISELPEVTFSDNCSNVTVAYTEYESRQSCEIDFGPVYTDSNIWFANFPFDENHYWNKGYYVQFFDGSTKVYGKTLNNSQANSGWDIEIYFDEPVSYSSWTSSGGQVGDDSQREQRRYAAIDFNKAYKLSGFGEYKNSNLSLDESATVNYMDIGPRDVYGDYGLGFWASYGGTVNGEAVNGASPQHIETLASLKKCVRGRDGAKLIVREWTVTDAAGNSNVFIQRVELEL